jgi:hypothetical protein
VNPEHVQRDEAGETAEAPVRDVDAVQPPVLPPAEPVDTPANGLAGAPLPAERIEPVTEAPPEPEPERLPVLQSRYAPRFRMLLGALVGIALGALGATLVIAANHQTSAPSRPWSAWQPSDRGADGAQEIADHVAPAYKLPGGRQLVAVTGGPLEVANLPVRIAFAQGLNATTVRVVSGHGVLYTLCGLGPRCAIATGKASPERMLLLRREALELALYTFRYLNGVDNVVALLPPRRGDKPTKALFFRHDGVRGALDQPLTATLPLPPPTTDSLRRSAQALEIQRLTDHNFFSFTVQQGQDNSAFLVLNPVLPGQ